MGSASPGAAFDRMAAKKKAPGAPAARPFKKKPAQPPVSSSGKRMARVEPSESATAASSTGPVEGIAEGVNVWHEKFGKGKVLRVEGASPNEKATVFFPKAGQKQLLLKFAKLEITDS
jgi:DNA helicase-2/ATP-dependent DNA helicase PcrA